MNSPKPQNKRIDVQSKSGLARLMAIENLHVRHSPNVTTANIDLIGRVVTLPILNKMEGYMYDWFIAHEISHALYTPADSIQQVEINHPELPFHYINITEDARIEKKIKRKYPGTVHDSNKFYKETSSPERDFFGYHKKIAEGVDPKKLPFIDRVNLHFKIGHLYNIPMNNQTEKDLIKQTGDAETFEEALQAALDIHEYVKKNKMKIPSALPKQHDDGKQGKKDDKQDGDGSGDSQQSQGQEEGDKDGQGNSSEGNDEQQQQPSKGSGSGEDDQQEETSGGSPEDSRDDSESESDTGDESEQDSTEDDGSANSEPDLDEDAEDEAQPEPDEDGQGDESNDEDGAGFSQSDFDDNFAQQEVNQEAVDEGHSFGDVARLADYKSCIEDYDEIFERASLRLGEDYIHAECMSNYTRFLAKITPTVNMMVTQFNMRKSAQEYQKTREASSGVLNMKKLATYQVNDDIFMKNEIVTQAENHGMVMLVDWSGSMTSYIEKTLKQLFVLMEFCNKVNIPFDVYAFASDNYGGSEQIPMGEIFSDQDSKLVHIFSSSERRTKFREHCARMNYLAENGSLDYIANMGCTPMYHAIFLSEYVIKDFQQKHKIEKTVMCVLTDGMPNDGMVEGHHRADRDITMRNRYTGKNYTFNQYDTMFHNLLHYVKEECNLSSLIGFYVTNYFSDSLPSLLCPDTYHNTEAYEKEYLEERYVELPSSLAFDKYYVVSVNNFDFNQVDHMQNVDGNTSKNAMLQAMKNQSQQGLKSMIFMKKFIEEIS